MSGIVKACCVVVIVGLASLLLEACGGSDARRLPSISAVGDGAQPALEQNADIAEILAAPVPDGVEPEMWDMLKSELAGEMQKRSSSDDRPGVTNEINGFRLWAWYDGLVWHGPILWGDGSRDGVVGIADLIAIAINWGRAIESEVLDDPKEMYLDYDQDGQVGISDVSVLARNWGQRGDTYTVEWSLSPEGSWNLAEEMEYGEFSETVLVCERVPISENTYLVVWEPYVRYFAFLDVHDKRRMYARVTKAHHEGQTTSYDAVIVAFSDPHRPPTGSVWGLASVPDKPNAITWSTRYLMADGNQNGITEITDMEILVTNFGQDTFEYPLATVADYNGDGYIFIGDSDYVYIDWGCCTERFAVEVSTESADAGFWTDGEVDYFEDSAGFNEYGFRYYEYQIQSPPEAPYWVRVTPWFEDMSGAPCEAIEMGGEI